MVSLASLRDIDFIAGVLAGLYAAVVLAFPGELAAVRELLSPEVAAGFASAAIIRWSSRLPPPPAAGNEAVT